MQPESSRYHIRHPHHVPPIRLESPPTCLELEEYDLTCDLIPTFWQSFRDHSKTCSISLPPNFFPKLPPSISPAMDSPRRSQRNIQSATTSAASTASARRKATSASKAAPKKKKPVPVESVSDDSESEVDDDDDPDWRSKSTGSKKPCYILPFNCSTFD